MHDHEPPTTPSGIVIVLTPIGTHLVLAQSFTRPLSSSCPSLSPSCPLEFGILLASTCKSISCSLLIFYTSPPFAFASAIHAPAQSSTILASILVLVGTYTCLRHVKVALNE